jgi:PAS domain S-box-containing protein
MALAVVLVSFLLRFALVQGLGLEMPTFITFYPAIIVVAILGGLGPGIFATMVTMLATDYFILTPIGHFGIAHASDAVALALFAVMGILISLLAESFRRAQQRIASLKEQQTLWETNQKLEVALASMADAVFITDTAGNFIHLNDAFARFLRFKNRTECPVQVSQYQNYLEVSTSDGELLSQEMWSVPRALRGESAANIEYRLRRKDTGETWLASYNFAPLRDSLGAIVGSVVVARDITEQRAAEQKLRERERDLTLIFRNMRDILFYLAVEPDSQFRFLSVNPAFLRATGLKADQIVGKLTQEVIPEPGHGIALQKYKDAVLEKTTVSWEETSVYPNGEKVGLVTVSPVLDERGRCANLIGIIHDITERKQAEALLKSTSRRLYSILSTMYSAVLLVTDDGQCEFANQAFCSLFCPEDSPESLVGLSRDGLLSKIRHLFPQPEEAAARLQEIVRQDLPALGEEISLSNGKVLLRDFVPLTIAGRSSGRIWVHTDITERKQAEEKLRKSETLYRGLFDSMDEGFCIIQVLFDPAGKPIDWRLLEVNAAFEKQTGLKDAAGKRIRELAPEIEQYWCDLYGKVALTGEPVHVFSGSQALNRCFEVAAYRVSDPELRQVAVVFSDVTDRIAAENHIRRLNRVYAVLSDINQTIVREKDSREMLQAACNIAVEKGFFRMAWIGMANPETQLLEPVASSGMVEGYLDKVRIGLLDTGPEAGPAARCFQSGQHQLCNDIEHQLFRPWKPDALQHGYRSMAAFPLQFEGKTVGIFCLYTTEVAFFDEEETHLLDEVSMDISFALEAYRHEEHRKRAEAHVRQLNRVYSVLSDVNQAIVREKNSQTLIETACNIAVEKGLFRMAWIGLIDPETNVLKPVASAGAVDGYFESLKFDLRDQAFASGPSVRSILSGDHALCNDIEHDPLFLPWREDAMRRGYRSSGGFPLKIDGKVVGVLNLYASEPGFFVAEEVSLLDEMAMDISFALEVNRREEERVKAEEELRWRTALFEAMVHSTEDGILVLDNQGKKILENQRLNELLGIPKEIAESSDAIRREFVATRVKDPEQFEGPLGYLVSHPEEVSRDEVELVNGTVIDRRSSPVRDTAQKQYGRIRQLRDITEQRQLEDQFRQAQKMEAIGQLTGGIAHDFNNLLTVILGCSEFIGEQVADNPHLSKMANMIAASARKGAELTHRMLAFARRQTLQPKLVNVNQLLAAMESFVRRTLTAEIDLQIVKCGEDCCQQDCEAVVDPTQLESSLLNLCVNARDAMPGGGKLTIAVGSAELDEDYARQNAEVTPGSYVLITVTDTGCGISPENLPRVFDPFFTTKEVGKGTGLGLSMVYGFARQTSGHVKIYSEVNHGTTVKLYLPRAGHQVEPSRPDLVSIEDLRGTENILLTEDDLSVREFAATQLAHLGYHVFEAANGVEALKVLAEHPEIDLLFTDMVMPGGMSGSELAIEATRLNSRLKVLYSSGYAENAIVHQGLLNSGGKLLNKPYTRLELARQIRTMLAQT